jgi:tight adherence protein B
MIGPEDLITALIFASVLAVVGLAAAFLSGSGKKRSRQLRRLAERFRTGRKAAVDNDAPSLFMDTSGDGILGSIEQSLMRLIPRSALLRLKLVRAGLNISPGRFATFASISGVLAGAVAFVAEHSPIIAVAIGLVGGLGLPNLWLSARIRKRKRLFVALFPQAVELMVRGLKSGVPINQTIISVGTEIRDPVGGEFQRIADSASLGVSLIDALWEAARRMDIAEFRFFVVAVSIQRETGGNLGETLENLADILRKRLQMQLKVKAMSSEARASAMIIGVLPFAMFGLLTMINPDYTLKLLTDPRGQMMAGAGLFLMGFGAFVMARMVKFEI